MNTVKDILKDNNSILIFDIDGVLAILEFGKYNHYILEDEAWYKLNDEGNNYYNENVVSKHMQNFLENKNKDNIYVISKVGSENEKIYKIEYCNKYYGIKKENVMFVNNNIEKTDMVKKIRENHPNVDDHHIVMIDDTVEILSDVMEKTNYSTAHISSFLDL